MIWNIYTDSRARDPQSSYVKGLLLNDNYLKSDPTNPVESEQGYCESEALTEVRLYRSLGLGR